MARIIIIDDDPLFARLAERRLEADGHQVYWQEGAFGALTAVRNGGYELILVDVQMPGIEGDKLVDVLRARGVGHATIILMSAIAEQDLKERATRYGADAYFPKGHNIDTLAGLANIWSGKAPSQSMRMLRDSSRYQVRKAR